MVKAQDWDYDEAEYVRKSAGVLYLNIDETGMDAWQVRVIKAADSWIAVIRVCQKVKGILQ